MTNQLSQLKEWLVEKRHFRTAWFAKDPQLTPEPDEALAQLPSNLSDELKAAVNQLPIVPEEEKVILEALDEEIQAWRKNPHLANNSMVILAHPVSSVARILTESLMTLKSQQDKPLKFTILDWIERPPDINDVKIEIKQKLDWNESRFPTDDGLQENCSSKSDETNSDETSSDKASSDKTNSDKTKDETKKPKILAVIPNLSWCFLRSAEGLAGIDYLQETLLSDRRQFWTIGSGQVGWDYLKSTLKFHAYCGKTVNLPSLNGQQLQAWITPIVEQFDICFSDAALHKRFQNPDSLLEMKLSIDKPIEAISEVTQEISATMQSSLRALKKEVLPDTGDDEDYNSRSDYFNRLADISDGISVVALQLFVKSLRYRKISQEELEENGLSPKDRPTSQADSGSASESTSHKSDSKSTDEPDEQRRIIAVVPKLPVLPELSQSDLYLLYSLMLHGDLTIRALANSLGDAPQVVNNQVQLLRNQDVIEQKDGVVKINPAHYPKLRRELANNNFVIEVF